MTSKRAILTILMSTAMALTVIWALCSPSAQANQGGVSCPMDNVWCILQWCSSYDINFGCSGDEINPQKSNGQAYRCAIGGPGTTCYGDNTWWVCSTEYYCCVFLEAGIWTCDGFGVDQYRYANNIFCW
jgi:hypothetical protein